MLQSSMTKKKKKVAVPVLYATEKYDQKELKYLYVTNWYKKKLKHLFVKL